MRTAYGSKRMFRNLKMALVFLIFFISLWFTLFTRRSLASEAILPPADQSQALNMYRKQPKTEMAKVNYLFNRFGKAPVKVIYDGHEYEMPEVVKTAKEFFFRRYHNETAEYWIKNYCYKSDSGNIIMFRLADGSLKPVRDAALEELAVLSKTA